ncbi:MAG: VOC family protein [Candidatus Cyclobacteriaceae bacterium M2_1C_046]
MKNFILLIGIVLSSYNFSSAQVFHLQFDHSTILVKDLNVSAEFYKKILQLKELKTPFGENPSILFFSIGGNQQLHIAQVKSDEIKLNKVIHMAFTVQNYNQYLLFLRENGIKYGNFAGNSTDPQIRPDGVKQIYFQDPDGYWIEINNAEYL